MRTKELITQLTECGLGDAQAKLYLAGLRSGPSLLAPLAREADVPRSTAYAIVEELAEQGLFHITQIGKRTMYSATPAAQLLAQAMRREERLRQLVPHLQSLTLEQAPDIQGESGTPLPFDVS